MYEFFSEWGECLVCVVHSGEEVLAASCCLGASRGSMEHGFLWTPHLRVEVCLCLVEYFPH